MFVKKEILLNASFHQINCIEPYKIVHNFMITDRIYNVNCLSLLSDNVLIKADVDHPFSNIW